MSDDDRPPNGLPLAKAVRDFSDPELVAAYDRACAGPRKARIRTIPFEDYDQVARDNRARKHGVKKHLADLLKDICLWVTAAEPGLGWEDQAFMNAYRANRTDAVELGVESDLEASAVRAMMDKRAEPWEGSACELLFDLAKEVPEKTQSGRDWPSLPAGLANKLRRAMPILRSIGIAVEMGMRSSSKDRKRLILICRGA